MMCPQCTNENTTEETIGPVVWHKCEPCGCKFGVVVGEPPNDLKAELLTNGRTVLRLKSLGCPVDWQMRWDEAKAMYVLLAKCARAGERTRFTSGPKVEDG